MPNIHTYTKLLNLLKLIPQLKMQFLSIFPCQPMVAMLLVKEK